MKKSIRIIAVISCLVIAATLFASCDNKGKSTTLGSPAQAAPLSYQEMSSDGYKSISESVKKFSSAFSANAYNSYNDEGNISVSPVAVYMALALAAESSYGQTRDEIISVLSTTYPELSENYSMLYRSMQDNFRTGELSVANSIWLAENLPFRQNCIDSLSQKYFCYSYSADFANDNENANRAVSYFVKKNTKGLIDMDFELSRETLFTLITALYLKDTWFDDGNDLSFTSEKYTFRGLSSDREEQFLQGLYNAGRTYDGNGYNMFYTETNHGYKLKFIVPDDGYTVKDVFNADTLDKVNSISDFKSIDEDARIRYYTRCIFPEFDAAYNNDIMQILKDMGITSLFSENDCDFSSLLDTSDTDIKAYCPKVVHATKLEVDKKGIEGAAVVAIPGDSASEPDEYTKVYQDFIVNKAFGFILTDQNDIPLFTGVINNI